MPPRAASCILGLVALSLVGCRNGARPGQTVHDPSTSSAAPFPPEVVAVCDTVAGLWRVTGRASVRVVDTTVRVLSDSQPQRGCAVVAAAPQGVDSTRWSRLYWTRSDARGWSDLSEFDADGPDGNNGTSQRGNSALHIETNTNGREQQVTEYIVNTYIRSE